MEGNTDEWKSSELERVLDNRFTRYHQKDNLEYLFSISYRSISTNIFDRHTFTTIRAASGDHYITDVPESEKGSCTREVLPTGKLIGLWRTRSFLNITFKIIWHKIVLQEYRRYWTDALKTSRLSWRGKKSESKVSSKVVAKNLGDEVTTEFWNAGMTQYFCEEGARAVRTCNRMRKHLVQAVKLLEEYTRGFPQVDHFIRIRGAEHLDTMLRPSRLLFFGDEKDTETNLLRDYQVDKSELQGYWDAYRKKSVTPSQPNFDIPNPHDYLAKKKWLASS
ncbi:hypothetical protein LTR43_009625 [Exophiala xenobiotica]